MPPLLQLQNYRGKGTESGEKKKKEVYASFFGWPEDCDFVGGGGGGGGGMRFGAFYSMNNKLLLVARHILTMGL